MSTKPESIIPEQSPTQPPGYGRDEMNLAEFPFATLRRRKDNNRKSIRYEGWITDKEGTRHKQKWVVRGLDGEGMDNEGVGLPTEYDERVYVALMYLTAESGFASRKVPFSMYRILQVMGLATNGKNYSQTERSLDRLKGVTIRTEGAFWDNERRERVKTVLAFNLIDEYWLSYKEVDERVIEAEGVAAYIMWSERLWASIRTGYIKSLDVAFFYSLQNPLSRRLYRFLDKRMQYQEQYEIDIFDLAGRLGMSRYRYPSKVIEKLHSGLDELIRRGFLTRAEPIKHGRYTRLAFTKGQPELITSTAVPAGPGEGGTLGPTALPAEVLLLEAGIGARVAKRLAREFEADYIHEKLDFLAYARRRGTPSIPNPRGWLRCAIEEDYGPPDGYGEDKRGPSQGSLFAGMFATDDTELDDVENTEPRAAPKSPIEDSYERQLWRDVLAALSSQMSRATYDSHLRSTKLVRIEAEATYVITVSNHLSYDWLEHRLKPVVIRALQDETGDDVTVVFEKPECV